MRIDVNKLLVLVGGVVVVGVALYFFLPAGWRWGPSEEPTLRHVAIVFRHGARSPVAMPRSDPYADDQELWPDGLGQLLLIGKQQIYVLGSFFRERYKSFIPKYEANEITVNSSGIDRTLMSAAMLLAGWFPPEQDQLWSEELLWQPIPVHSVSSQYYMIGLGEDCPRYHSAYREIEKEAKGNWTQDDKRMWEYLQIHMEAEREVDYIVGPQYYFTLKLEQDLGLQLPEWTKEVFPEKMEATARYTIRMLMWNDYMRKVAGGFLLKDVIDHMKEKVEGTEEHEKLFLYAGHDSDIFALATTLGYNTDEFFYPQFGSSLMFELHKVQGSHFYVKLFYLNDSSSTEPLLLDMPVCPNPCSFAELYNATEYMRSFNPETDC